MRVCAFIAAVVLVFSISFGQTSQYVIVVSVDGARPDEIQSMITSDLLPNFERFQTEGVWTNNARADYDITVTLPNHTTEMTSRGIIGVNGNGHGWTSNSDPAAGQTIHSNKGGYVASVFDVAHDNGLRTAVYATKTKFSLFDTSYNATNGAPDVTGVDNGRDKLDTYQYNSSSASLTSQFYNAMSANPFNFSLVHFTDGDTAGHAAGWDSDIYKNAIQNIDGYLGQLFEMVADSTTLTGKTSIILTADHGGHYYNHADSTDPLNYTIPFYVWGPAAAAGVDLYSLNVLTRLNPGAGRPTYSNPMQPIRNGEAGNLALDLLGLGPIPGSTINYEQNLMIPEPGMCSLMLVGILAVRRMKRNLNVAA